MKNIQKIFIIILSVVMFALFANDTHAFKSAESSAKLQADIAVATPDNRVEILRDFLLTYDSPLAGNAKDFVETADKYNLDWRLVASIAGLESTFGKRIPYESYNAWGWGVYGDNVIKFDSWAHGIETISKGLRENYLKEKMESDPYFIGPTYAASKTWAERVSFFMAKMEEYRIRNAKSTLALAL